MSQVPSSSKCFPSTYYAFFNNKQSGTGDILRSASKEYSFILPNSRRAGTPQLGIAHVSEKYFHLVQCPIFITSVNEVHLEYHGFWHRPSDEISLETGQPDNFRLDSDWGLLLNVWLLRT